MFVRIFTIALGFVLIAAAGAPPKAAAQSLVAQVPVPSPSPVPRRMRSNKFRFELSTQFGPVSTNVTGAQGNGSALYVGLQIDTPRTSLGRFTDVVRFTRYNTELPRLNICPGCDTEENDDYYMWQDYLYDDFEINECDYSIGLSYNYDHPVYAFYDNNLSGVGITLAKLPDYRKPWGIYGSVNYIPTFTNTVKTDNPWSYSVWQYDVGITAHPNRDVPLTYELGLKSENWIGKGMTQPYRLTAPYLGVATRF